MNKQKSRRNQKVYKMKGCSKTRKNYLGGSIADFNLAYPSNNIQTVPNPFLSYTGKGGAACSTGISPSNLAYPENVNGVNPAYPSTGPPSNGFNFLNPQGNLHGGNKRGSCKCGCKGKCKCKCGSGCGCNCNCKSGSSSMKGGSCGCGLPLMSGGGKKSKGKKGGSCGSLCSLGFMAGGSSHRDGCRCSQCKKNMSGGDGNNGIPYPDGLVGTPWTPAISGWPGVDGVSGDANYYTNNTYNNDVSRQMLDIGANPPYNGLKGGTKKRRQKAGALSNFLGQDLINLGRQFQFGVGSAYNALAGYPSPVNPLPWKDQMLNTSSLGTV